MAMLHLPPHVAAHVTLSPLLPPAPHVIPATGDKTDSSSADVARFTAFLRSKCEAVLAFAGVDPANIRKHFGITFPGCAVDNLTPEQVAALQSNPDVVAVSVARVSVNAESASVSNTGSGGPGMRGRKGDAMRAARLMLSGGAAAALAAEAASGGSRRLLQDKNDKVSSELALGSAHLFDLQIEKLWKEVGGVDKAGEPTTHYVHCNMSLELVVSVLQRACTAPNATSCELKKDT